MSLEQMCVVLNRLLTIDNEACQTFFKAITPCSPKAWPHLIHDPEITVHVTVDVFLRGSGELPTFPIDSVSLTPLLMINSLVSEERADGLYSIFRDIDDQENTINFFVSKVKRTS